MSVEEYLNLLLKLAKEAHLRKHKTFNLPVRIPGGTRGPLLPLVRIPGLNPLSAKILQTGKRGNTAGLVQVRVVDVVSFVRTLSILYPAPQVEAESAVKASDEPKAIE